MNKEYILYKIYLIFLLMALLIFISFLALGIGIEEFGFLYVLENIFNLILGQNLSAEFEIILEQIRLPRIYLAILAGAGLALSGLGTQAVLCNPLVSPSILGLSAGAAFGASIAILSGNNEFTLIVYAFLGAGLAVTLSYFIASLRQSRREVVILAGVAIGFIFSGLTVLLQYLAPFQSLRTIVFWTIGSLWNANMELVYILFPVVFGGGILFFLLSTSLNSLLLGEENAMAIGIDVKKVRLYSLILSTIVCATIVAFCGAIGFIGLIAPHIARTMFGSNHYFLVPTSMLLGALLLLLADSVSRFMLWPQELPVGIMTALIGGPFFLFQLIRSHQGRYL